MKTPPRKSTLRNGNSSNLFRWKDVRSLCHPRKQEALWPQVTVPHQISFSNSYLCFSVLTAPPTCTMMYDIICKVIDQPWWTNFLTSWLQISCRWLVCLCQWCWAFKIVLSCRQLLRFCGRKNFIYSFSSEIRNALCFCQHKLCKFI